MQLESEFCKFIENVGMKEKERSLKTSLQEVEDKLNGNLSKLFLRLSSFPRLCINQLFFFLKIQTERLEII